MQFTQFGLEEDVHISFIDFGQSESLLNLKSKILCACVRACVRACTCVNVNQYPLDWKCITNISESLYVYIFICD